VPSPLSPFSLFPVKSTEKLPDCFPSQTQDSELLGRFSQAVGSAASPSGWVIPDCTISRIVECPYTSSTLHNPRSDNSGFEDPFLHLRSDNMDDFGDCDPNSPGALERYTSWIDHDHYGEQYALREYTQNTQQSTQQAGSHIELPFNPRSTPRIPQQASQQYPADVRLSRQVFRPPPSVDDSDNDEETDEFTNNGYGRLLSSPGSFTESSSSSSTRFSSVDHYEQTTVYPHCGRDGRYTIGCCPPNALDLPMVSSDSEYSDEGPITCYWDSDFEDDEEIGDDWVDVRNQISGDSNVIRCYAPNSPPMDIGSEYDADSEASESMWNSNKSILLGSDLRDYEVVKNGDYAWNPNALSSSPNQLIESDFWNTSTELRYLVSRFSGFFDVPDSSAITGLVYNECVLLKPVDELTEQNLFSLTSVYSFDTPFQHDIIPAEYKDVYYYPHPLPSVSGTPKLGPTIFDSSWHDRAYSLRVSICYDSRPRTFAFGTGIGDQFPFTFKHDEPPFRPEECLCRSPAWCNLRPFGQFLGKRSALVRRRREVIAQVRLPGAFLSHDLHVLP
jgi:hypothetical protein